MIGSQQQRRRALVNRNTAGGSAARQSSAAGLGSVIAWALAQVAQNNGVEVPVEVLLAASSGLAGIIGGLWRRYVIEPGA